MTTITKRPYQTITTRFLGPTNYRPARIKAMTASGKSVALNWDHELDGYGNAARAAYALIDEMDWGGHWISGATRDGYVFVRDH